MFFPRQVRLGRTAPLPESLALAPAEGGRWLLPGDDPRPRRDRVRPRRGASSCCCGTGSLSTTPAFASPAPGPPPTPCSRWP